ncbi:hypothetical protein ACFL1A_01705 [Patescibacteria group bacterium]
MKLIRFKKLVYIVFPITLILVFIIPSFLSKKAQAVTYQSAKLTISDSRASQTGVSYAFSLGSPSATAIKTIDIYFCTNASGACSAASMDADPGDDGISISDDGIDGSGETAGEISSAAHTARITVGTPAAQTTDPLTFTLTGVTNPSASNSSVYARIVSYDASSDQIDEATVAMAVLEANSIYVTASVESIFTFTVSAVTVGSVNGASIDLTDTTANTIPFGVLTAGTPVIAAHDINIKSNANNGYVVTVEADATPPLSDGATGNNIDEFTGTNAAPTTWSEPAGSTKNVNTGFFGYTTEDSVLGTGTADRFTSAGGDKWAGTTTSPLEVIYNAVAPGSGAGETTRLGWELEVNTYQPPGDYTGSVTLIATPTY